MRFVFRADASSVIGAGHVMRCNAIAEEGVSRGLSCLLVGSLGGLSWLEARLTETGMRVESPRQFASSRVKSSDVLIVDSYSVSSVNSFISARHWTSVVSLVDEISPIIKADLVIHPGLDGDWFPGSRENFLSGSQYIPLRRSIGKSQVAIGANLKSIVVFGGGTDVFDFSYSVALKLAGLFGFEKAYFFSDKSLDLKSLDPRFQIVPFGNLLDQVIENADLILTTASTSSLEVLAREIPMGVACAVDNQQANYSALGKTRAVSSIGYRPDSKAWFIDESELKRLVHNKDYRRLLKTNAHGLIDLKGAGRIVDAILSLQVN